MDWFGGIFEGTSHEFVAWIGTYSSSSWNSKPESEDINRAFALSLATEGNMKHLINDSRLKEDENLARALHESLNVESPTRNQNVNRNGNVYQHI
ncbi:protein DA1 isoform X1, partial [Tanacetum coccineum]